jgi:hypothetical protein
MYDQREELYTKQKAEQAQCANNLNAGCAVGLDPSKPHLGDECSTSAYRLTLREQAEKNAGIHFDQANKHVRASVFLRENPAFDEFVRLVREGVIQF